MRWLIKLARFTVTRAMTSDMPAPGTRGSVRNDAIIMVIIVGSFLVLTMAMIPLFEWMLGVAGIEMDYITNTVMLGCILAGVAAIAVPAWKRLSRSPDVAT